MKPIILNKQIRQEIKKSDLRYWQVAKQMQVDPSTLSRWLRDELKDERLAAVLGAIEGLKGTTQSTEGENNAG